MDAREVVIDARDVLRGVVIAQNWVVQTTLAGSQVEQAEHRPLHRSPPHAGEVHLAATVVKRVERP